MLEKLLLRKFWKIIRKTSLVAFLLKKFKLSNPPIYNYRKTDSAANTSFLCFENFKIGLRASVVEPHLSKVTEPFGFYREIQHVYGMFRKVALLEILKTPLLTGVQAYSTEFERF